MSAEVISDTCGQTISHGGVWNLIQELRRISEEEDYAVKQMKQTRQKEKRQSGSFSKKWMAYG